MRFLVWAFLFFVSCSTSVKETVNKPEDFVVVLGIAQDAGYPQIACGKKCCRSIWHDPSKRKSVSSLGVVDQGKTYLIDATPDIKDQLENLKTVAHTTQAIPEAIFLTHAHMGHYTGLMQLGREALGGDKVDVYTMPRMHKYLSNNGPWDQLVSLENIKLNRLKADSTIALSNTLSITPFKVPHRDEYSETVGYKIIGSNTSVLFIPDIDKWHMWDRDIKAEILKVDYALLDGTFFANGEIIGRDMSSIPHPFIEESMTVFKDLPNEEKNKIYFIHLNHTNPLLNLHSAEAKTFKNSEFRLAQEGQIIPL